MGFFKRVSYLVGGGLALALGLAVTFAATFFTVALVIGPQPILTTIAGLAIAGGGAWLAVEGYTLIKKAFEDSKFREAAPLPPSMPSLPRMQNRSRHIEREPPKQQQQYQQQQQRQAQQQYQHQPHQGSQFQRRPDIYAQTNQKYQALKKNYMGLGTKIGGLSLLIEKQKLLAQALQLLDNGYSTLKKQLHSYPADSKIINYQLGKMGNERSILYHKNQEKLHHISQLQSQSSPSKRRPKGV